MFLNSLNSLLLETVISHAYSIGLSKIVVGDGSFADDSDKDPDYVVPSLPNQDIHNPIQGNVQMSDGKDNVELFRKKDYNDG